MTMGCASSYKAIQPTNLAFDNDQLLEGDSSVSIAYRYGVMRAAGNDRYADMEAKAGICILGMRIDNQSDDTLYFPENFAFYNNDVLLEPVVMDANDKRFKQLESGQIVTEYPVINTGWFIDLPILFNIYAAEDADQKMQEEFQSYYLVYSYVLPHSAVQGLVAFKVKPGTPLSVAKRELPLNKKP